jgi:hypothetical protein
MGRGKCDVAGCSCGNYENSLEKCANGECGHERSLHGIIGCSYSGKEKDYCECKNFAESDEDVLCEVCGHKRSEHKLTY